MVTRLDIALSKITVSFSFRQGAEIKGGVYCNDSFSSIESFVQPETAVAYVYPELFNNVWLAEV